MSKRPSTVYVLCVIVLFGLLWGAFWQKSSQAAILAASLDVPFFSQTALRTQLDSEGRVDRLGNSDLPLWEYGCGVASLAMLYRQYGVDTDVARLNDALHASGGFVGGLLAWGNADAFIQAGRPWVKGVERIDTTRPQDYRQRIDRALDNGEPVIVYLKNEHYVVLVGKEGDRYRINDPWAVTADAGKDIALDKNLLAKGGFDSIRQLVFISRQEYAPSNGVLVQGAIRDRYIASRGAQGPLGNPLQAQESLSGGGVWQRFERGAIFAPTTVKPTLLYGPVWDKFQAEGGAAVLGLPSSDVYSYFVGPAVEWRADFAAASILWSEGDRPDRARVIDAAVGGRADYFANPDLSGQPAYSRYEEDLLFDWGSGAPGPWVGVDNFSVRYTQTFRVGGLGWRYNFVLDTDNGVRVMLDGKPIVNAWEQPGQTRNFSRNLGRGKHELVLEYRHRSGDARLLFARSTWPATPVFAAENTAGSFETLPVSVAASVPDLGTPMAQATATAAGVIATLTAEAHTTPTPDTRVADTARANFARWAQNNGEPFRDVQVTVQENDGFFASVQVIAWFRPQRQAPWEEREAALECRRVDGEWQCDERFAFALTQGERARRAQATATVAAQTTATTQAAAAATAIAAVRATAVANIPAALRNVYDRFDMKFVYVPAGKFTMGSTEAEVDTLLDLCNPTYDYCERFLFENEMPQHQVTLDAFWVGKTEVTNAQYRAFVEGGGYTQPDLWTAAGWEWRQDGNVTQPKCWDNEQWNQPDSPVVCVTWFEAVAFANWLARETGLPIRLPSEAEWEKAARGTDGRTWPWGNKLPDGSRMNYCDANCELGWKDENVNDGYPYTAPVATYPAGASPYGALDMTGNVWEWTDTAWGGCRQTGRFAYPYRADDGREDLEGDDCRVVRGGAWDGTPYSAAVVYRSKHAPHATWDDYGFRVVWSASVPIHPGR